MELRRKYIVAFYLVEYSNPSLRPLNTRESTHALSSAVKVGSDGQKSLDTSFFEK